MITMTHKAWPDLGAHRPRRRKGYSVGGALLLVLAACGGTDGDDVQTQQLGTQRSAPSMLRADGGHPDWIIEMPDRSLSCAAAVEGEFEHGRSAHMLRLASGDGCNTRPAAPLDAAVGPTDAGVAWDEGFADGTRPCRRPSTVYTLHLTGWYGADFGAAIAVYDAQTGRLVASEVSDRAGDRSHTQVETQLTVRADAGRTYRLVVFSVFSGAVGPYQLSVTCGRGGYTVLDAGSAADAGWDFYARDGGYPWQRDASSWHEIDAWYDIDAGSPSPVDGGHGWGENQDGGYGPPDAGYGSSRADAGWY